MIDLKRLKTETLFGYFIGVYCGKYRPTPYTLKRAARKLMRKNRTRNGDYFAYYCGKDGKAYKCAIASFSAGLRGTENEITTRIEAVTSIAA